MEASKFGFGVNAPPAFKFDPTDADIVAHYLLPRALGLPNPYASAIIEGVDPGSFPPWEILGNKDHAFLFGPPKDLSHNGGRTNRTMQGGGVWNGQKGYEETITLTRPSGGELDITFKRYHLSYSLTKGGPSSGYVMHEFTIVSPPLPGTVLSRIRFKKSAKRPPATDACGADEQHADPYPEQPGPSYEYGDASNGAGFAAAQDGALYDSDVGFLQYTLPVGEYDGNYYASIPDQPSTSYNYNGEFTDAQTDAFDGGGMVTADGAYYDSSNNYIPECGSEYGNCYDEYQQWQYEEDQSNQYQAGDATVMCAGDEAVIGDEEAGGTSDKGSVIGTDTTAHSTISFCSDREQDDTTFYNTLFGISDDFNINCERNDAGDPSNE